MPRIIALACAAVLLAGCGMARVQAPVMPPTAFAFANQRAPLTYDFDETPVGSKHGIAEVTFVQDPLLTGFNVAWGDASIEAAAEEGGIDRVHYADYELLNVLGIFVRFTVHAYGD